MSLNCQVLEGTMKSNSVALSGRAGKIRAKRSFWKGQGILVVAGATVIFSTPDNSTTPVCHLYLP